MDYLCKMIDGVAPKPGKRGPYESAGDTMDSAFILFHVRKDDEHGDDSKIVGIYRSGEAAQAAILRVADKPGFRDNPGGFMVDRYEMDKDHWTEGFGSSDEPISN
jgi:hypothetical protein